MKQKLLLEDEFNGSGKKVYLRTAQHNTYAPLSQENVRLTPDFSQYALLAVGDYNGGTDKDAYIECVHDFLLDMGADFIN